MADTTLPVISITNPTVAWTRLVGTSSYETASALTIGADGSIYVTGTTQGNLDSQARFGGYDVFLTKYKSDGTKVWTRLLGNSNDQYANALTTGQDGSIYVGGSTKGSLDGQNYFGQEDAFITKYNSDGTKLWTRTLGSNDSDESSALTIGLDGSIFVSGFTQGVLEGLKHQGGADVFITKYNPSGIKDWTRVVGTSDFDAADAITTGKDGAIYVTGITYGNFDGQINAGDAFAFVDSDAFISKYNPDGTKLWTRLLGTSSADEARAITAGVDGSIYVAGSTKSNLDGQNNNGEYDAFITKYNPDGTKVWTRLIGSNLYDSANSITAGNDGSIYVAGTTSGNYGTGPINGNFDGQIKRGGQDVFVTKYLPNGIKVWTLLFGTTSDDVAKAVTTGADGAIFLTGHTNGNLNGEINGGFGKLYSSSFDAFIIKLVVDSDTTPPTIALSSSTSSLSGSQTATINFVLSEASTNFTSSDVVVVGGTLSNFTGSGAAYTAVFNPTANSNINGSVTVPNGVFTDAAGNSNADGSEANNSLYFTRTQTVTNKANTLSVIVDKNVLSASATLLKELKESITYTNGSITKHSVEYAGLTFDYDQIDSLITTVTRDGEFTSEFTKEINDYLKTELNITYSAAVALIGTASIDGVILSVAGADGNFVG